MLYGGEFGGGPTYIAPFREYTVPFWEGRERAGGREAEDLERLGGVGLTVIRSMSCWRRSRSRSACPSALPDFARSVKVSSNCEPSSLRLLTNASTFFFSDSTVSFNSV